MSESSTFVAVGVGEFAMVTPNPIRLLSVEDHPVFREGLRSIISMQPDMVLVAQATNAVEALAEFRRNNNCAS